MTPFAHNARLVVDLRYGRYLDPGAAAFPEGASGVCVDVQTVPADVRGHRNRNRQRASENSRAWARWLATRSLWLFQAAYA